ncbi:unnamed protein product [Allacma fusca]|uniref:Uncharacterized protein n=1 Tax=Allacma fusca TaxID=39272 RepID=A0A8J2P598_9HEXA|nr:unnamed protein product [Allacma fusca]
MFKKSISKRQKRRKLSQAVQKELNELRNISVPNLIKVASDSGSCLLDLKNSCQMTLNPLIQNSSKFPIEITPSEESIPTDCCEDFCQNSDFVDSESSDSLSEDTSSVNRRPSPAGQLQGELCQWAIKNNITHNAIDSLLKLLQSYHPELPCNARKLLETPRHIEIYKMEAGEYFHLGFYNTLKRRLELKNRSGTGEETVKLRYNFNIDGLPIYSNSNNGNLWPILAQDAEHIGPPFLIGSYIGKSEHQNGPCGNEDTGLAKQYSSIEFKEYKLKVNGKDSFFKSGDSYWKLMFALVKFLKEDSCEIVPFTWISADFKTCKWPGSNFVKRAIEKKLTPQENWSNNEINLIRCSVLYEDLVPKRTKYLLTSKNTVKNVINAEEVGTQAESLGIPLPPLPNVSLSNVIPIVSNPESTSDSEQELIPASPAAKRVNQNKIHTFEERVLRELQRICNDISDLAADVRILNAQTNIPGKNQSRVFLSFP